MDISNYLPIWNTLSDNDRRELQAAARGIEYKRGAILHSANDCMGLFLVSSGQLRAYTVSEDGREVTLYRLFERDMCLFSASCMMRSIQFDISISAEKDTEVILIPTEVYRSVMERSAPLANYTNEIMASRFSEVMWLIEQIMWKSLDRRLADFLLNESAIEGTSRLSITHDTVGKHLGSPREVISRMLKYFESEGIVRLSRGIIEILKPHLLEKICK